MPTDIPERVQFDPAAMSVRDCYLLITGIVVPRPIGWISTLGQSGVANLAPYSYFNAFSSDPPMIGFSSLNEKDTVRNVRATANFVANIVTEDLMEQMNFSAVDFPPEESEFTWAGLTPAPSARVAAPRVAEAKLAMECRLVQIVELGRAPSYLVIGEVVCIHADPTVVRNGRIDPALLKPVGRLSGSGYTRVADGLFNLRRSTLADVQGRTPPLTSRE